jgi:DNA-binding beta-propeller fold protein YncE
MQIMRSLVAVCAFGCGLAAGAQRPWKVAATWPVGGEGGWDYVTVDAPGHRFFVTRATHTQVIDERTGALLADIAGQGHSHGVTLAAALNRGFITDSGGTGLIWVFDLTTYAVLGKIAAMPDADGAIYDEATHSVLVSAGDSEALLTLRADVDVKAGKIDAPILLGGKPEFLASDGKGIAYVNLEDKDVVVKVDLRARKVVARWPVAPGGTPVGMAIDREHGRLYVGCRKPAVMVVMSTEDGKVLGSAAIGAGVDATAFGDGEAFASCRDGSLSVMREREGRFVVEQVLKTGERAGTMGIDAEAGKILVPAASFDPAVGTARPKMNAGSFEVLEVSR